MSGLDAAKGQWIPRPEAPLAASSPATGSGREPREGMASSRDASSPSGGFPASRPDELFLSYAERPRISRGVAHTLALLTIGFLLGVITCAYGFGIWLAAT